MIGVVTHDFLGQNENNFQDISLTESSFQELGYCF